VTVLKAGIEFKWPILRRYSRKYEEPHSLQNIIRKSRRVTWAWYVACTGEKCIHDFGVKATRKETTRKI
jgi:hypothetical protein